jgi:hypothetical protein
MGRQLTKIIKYTMDIKVNGVPWTTGMLL